MTDIYALIFSVPSTTLWNKSQFKLISVNHRVIWSVYLKVVIVSTGGIQWILWFSFCYAAARREIFGVNALRGKLH